MILREAVVVIGASCVPRAILDIVSLNSHYSSLRWVRYLLSVTQIYSHPFTHLLGMHYQSNDRLSSIQDSGLF